MRRALGIDERVYGPDHPNVASDLNNLARLLRAQSHGDEAERLLRRALASVTYSLGPPHPAAVEVRDNLDALLRALGKTQEVDQLLADSGNPDRHRPAAGTADS